MTPTTAPAGLDAEQRSTLEHLIIRARTLLEDDLAAQAEGRFGIHLDGTVEDETALPDDTTDKATRRDLEQIVNHLRSLGEDPPGAVARLLREASFTHLNRLVAIRIAEAIGLLPESLARGPQSQGFRDLGEIMPVLAGDYRSYVRLCGDELAADAPALFDPRNPLLALEPSTAAFDGLVALLATADTADMWRAPDTLGWAYQFFNTGEERREMRESSAPRNSRELAVRNQFFTPRYVVDFLVQNSLGRRLIESDPKSPLLDELPLLVDPPSEPGGLIDLNEVKCLDPACGSGHFLLGCYDVLERAWELAGISAATAAPKIVAALWGVDIDPRCAQVASAAITLRARRHCRDLTLPRPNIVTARGLPGGSAALSGHADLSPDQRALIDRTSDALAEAPTLGVLLKAEEALGQEIRRGVFGSRLDFKPGMLELTDEAAEATERQLLDHLQAIADEASSSVVDRLLAAEADDALRLVEVVRQRYDVVLMNPPFGEPVPETRSYLKAAYPWIPVKGFNLLAAFVGRGLELCNDGGCLGAITSRVGFFLSTYEEWRREVLLSQEILAVADLGLGVMEQAVVEAAAYVVRRKTSAVEVPAVFVRLLKDVNKATALADAVRCDRAGVPDGRVFRPRPSEFGVIPQAPFAYWISPEILDLFGRSRSLEATGILARRGLQTTDDFRFIRAAWEVDPRKVATTREQTTRGGRTWALIAKGGDYSPFWSDTHLVVKWANDGEEIRSLPNAIVPGLDFYFRAGATWPRRTKSGFGVRLLPSGLIFGDQAPAAFSDTASADAVVGWLNSRPCRALVDASMAAGDETSSGGAARSYQVGVVQELPWPSIDEAAVGALTRELIIGRRELDKRDECTRLFERPHLPTGTVVSGCSENYELYEAEVLKQLSRAERLDQLVCDQLGLSPEARAYLDLEIGPMPTRLTSEWSESLDVVLEDFYGCSEDVMVDRAAARGGGLRYLTNLHFWADRRIEVTALALGVSPDAIATERSRHGFIPAGLLEDYVRAILSYGFGCAVGRWDVRNIQRSISDDADPSTELPACPPGMLIGPDGMPPEAALEGYPLEVPSSGLLVDEPGHPWDVEERLIRALSELFEDQRETSLEMLSIVGRKTLRDYLRRSFFKDHLSRYTKSRRRAPIYWQLSLPSRNWGVWIYAPRLNRQTLYSVAGEARRRERLAADAMVRLQHEQGSDGGRPPRKVAEELDAEERLAEELRLFRSEVERIAGLGWEPDLDDGYLLCAAPLANLLPSWADAKAARMELRNGQHSWSRVAAWADQL